MRFKHLECPPLEFQDAKNERNTNGTWVQMGKNGLNRWSKLKHSYDVYTKKYCRSMKIFIFDPSYSQISHTKNSVSQSASQTFKNTI